LAVQMRYGALPIPLQVVDVRTIGASLGQDSVDSSLRAGIIGMAMVLLFMLVIYRLPGLLASLALIFYITLNLTVYKLIPVTLTLPGIAGFLLSIGMAVDANILIFERMKEELRSGRSLRLAVEVGFSRAWPAIRDGNFSTLISCAVLYWFGNNFGASIVKGFAITLALGVLLSMFTAVFVTRTFMRLFLSRQGQKLVERRALLGY
jgi:preprotein translocase subunit SecD